MKQVSIIIPHYNSVISLRRLLNSIPDQSWLEVIVVDDHSDEETQKKLEEVKLEFKNVLYFSVRQGQKSAGAARNVGLEKSSGKWLLFADADDYFEDGAFDVLEEYLASRCQIVLFRPSSRNEAGVTGTRHLKYSEMVDTFLKSKCKDDLFRFYAPWSKLIARDLVLSNGIFFEEVLASNDVMFSLKTVFYATDICADRRRIYCITESANSLTRQKSKTVIDSRFEVACRFNEFLSENGESARTAMFPHIWRARHQGMKIMWQRLVYSKRKKYPIFNSLGAMSSCVQKRLKDQ